MKVVLAAALAVLGLAKLPPDPFTDTHARRDANRACNRSGRASLLQVRPQKRGCHGDDGYCTSPFRISYGVRHCVLWRYLNNSWTWFSSWLQTNITNGTVRSMITEFGWNPGQMSICGLTQYDSWPGTGTCASSDGYTHTFD